ncbi:MAG: hypothetical protein ABIV93_30265 [Byssovorax sp.]
MYRVTGELRSGTGDVTLTNTFSELECSTAIRSLAIIVAVRFTRLPEPCPICPPPLVDPASPALSRPVSSLVQPTPTPAPPLPPSPAGPSFRAGISSVFALGAAPVVLGGIGWFIDARWPRFSVALEGQALFAPSAELPTPRMQDGYHFFFATALASGCVHGAWAFACMQVRWHSISFGHSDLSIELDHTSTFGFGFRFGGERALTHAVALRAYIDGVFDTNPASFTHVMRRNESRWHTPIVSASLGFGPVMTF